MDKGISLTVERFCCSDGWDSVSWSVDAVAGLASARRRDRHRPRGPCVGLPHEAWAAFKQSPRVQQVERWRIRGEMVSTRRGIPSATRAKLQPVHMPRAPDPATTARRVDHGPQPLLSPSTLFDETRRGVELWGEAHEQIPPQDGGVQGQEARPRGYRSGSQRLVSCIASARFAVWTTWDFGSLLPGRVVTDISIDSAWTASWTGQLETGTDAKTRHATMGGEAPSFPVAADCLKARIAWTAGSNARSVVAFPSHSPQRVSPLSPAEAAATSAAQPPSNHQQCQLSPFAQPLTVASRSQQLDGDHTTTPGARSQPFGARRLPVPAPAPRHPTPAGPAPLPKNSGRGSQWERRRKGKDARPIQRCTNAALVPSTLLLYLQVSQLHHAVARRAQACTASAPTAVRAIVVRRWSLGPRRATRADEVGSLQESDGPIRPFAHDSDSDLPRHPATPYTQTPQAPSPSPDRGGGMDHGCSAPFLPSPAQPSPVQPSQAMELHPSLRGPLPPAELLAKAGHLSFAAARYLAWRCSAHAKRVSAVHAVHDDAVSVASRPVCLVARYPPAKGGNPPPVWVISGCCPSTVDSLACARVTFFSVFNFVVDLPRRPQVEPFTVFPTDIVGAARLLIPASCDLTCALAPSPHQAPLGHHDDFETASIRSAAPSYVSEAPSYHSTAQYSDSAPPYAPRGAAPAAAGAPARNSSSTPRPRTIGLPPIPPLAPQSAVALPNFRIPTWSANNAPAARHYRNVAERRITDGRYLSDGPAGRRYSAASTVDRTLDHQTGTQTTTTHEVRPLEDPYLVGEVAAAQARRERLARESGEDVLLREDRQWDWLLAQMKSWDERERSWAKFRRDLDNTQRKKLLHRIGGRLLS
ncbi:hypothetical protein Purlil1_8654 [Purpureocillium lilacinum]|uniref:Uncharacterized protein n=1 Tax=Purpureocillium lilacinum TaxID=33203 RepID=A0ABR0BSB8_PURLI|nr:hypothetical protein Purlil1_8654 [Purpureocillium lilacinum]